MTIRDLAEQIAEIVSFTGDIMFDPTKPDGTPQKLLDVSRLADLDWRAQIDLTRGLRATYDWYVTDSALPTDRGDGDRR